MSPDLPLPADSDTGVGAGIHALAMARIRPDETSRFQDAPRPCMGASVEQEGILLLEQIQDAGWGAGVVVASAEIEGDLEVESLSRAWRALIMRHESLLVSFARENGHFVAERRPATEAEELTLEIVDAPDERTWREAISTLGVARLDPYAWPLCRAWLLRSGGERCLVALAFHSVVFDETSADLAVRDLLAFYAAFATGHPVELPPILGTARDFVGAEREAMRNLLEHARAYWEPRLDAVADSARIRLSSEPAAPPRGGSTSVGLAIEPGVRERLAAVSSGHGASLFLSLLAAVQVLQYRYSGAGDEGVATAVTVNARPRSLQDAIGMFSTELPFFSLPRDDVSYLDFVSDVEQRSRELFALRRFPFTEALARFGEGAGTRGVAGQVSFSYRRPVHLPSLPGAKVLARDVVPRASSPRPLTVTFVDDRSGLSARIDFDSRAIPPAAATRMAGHLGELLFDIGKRPAAALAQLKILPADERDRILDALSASDGPSPQEATAITLVEAQVARTPDATAITFNGEALSYGEVNARANRLAHHLRSLGAGPGELVGISLTRSPDMIVGLLAILKAGGAYVPLDPSYPMERLQVMVDEARPRVLLSQRQLEGRLPQTRGRLLLMDGQAESEAILGERDSDPNPLADPDDLAYVIFTSGSTGRPKGVAMPHRPLRNLLEWQMRRFGDSAPRRTLQFTSVSFDVAFQEIFSTLSTGGSLVLLSDEVRRDFAQLAELVDGERIERMFLPPLALTELARRLPPAPPGAAPVEVTTAGERLEITPGVRELWQRRPGWTLDNQYGPTESHVVTAHRLEGDPGEWPQLPPIGRPIVNARIYVLDRRGAPVPVGVPGELFIGGLCLARGYLNQPKLTVERFVQDPFDGADARMYRTGDLARWREDGDIEFLGRLDDQVKIRGFRIEPEEVASALNRHSAVAQAAVVADGQRLLAYLVPTGDNIPSTPELRDFAGHSLPDYMVPAAFVTLPALPITPNGKLDRRALPTPDFAAQPGSGFVDPRTSTEQGVARIWADVLGLERVGADDNFFELGGHSLLAAEVVSTASRTFDVGLPLRVLFAGPTVAQMASAIEEARRVGAAPTRIPRAPRRRIDDIMQDSP